MASALWDLNEAPLPDEQYIYDGEEFEEGQSSGDMEQDEHSFDLNQEPGDEEGQSSEAEHNTEATQHHQPTHNTRLSSDQKMHILNALLAISREG